MNSVNKRQPINGVGNIMKNRKYEELDVPYFTDRTRASLKIQKGRKTSAHSVLFHGLWLNAFKRSGKSS